MKFAPGDDERVSISVAGRGRLLDAPELPLDVFPPTAQLQSPTRRMPEVAHIVAVSAAGLGGGTARSLLQTIVRIFVSSQPKGLTPQP